ncbi:Protein BONZAI 2 [Camellia lanceoleosa]|uniref:Protein BONZAI 2 n=1 Tax=Camellia lanceoleosa TaxID=1840588 RepID=A0ACC0HCT8_9ERIC|nr:Protein BONZAI 2 [Camellia lanceoleosa]
MTLQGLGSLIRHPLLGSTVASPQCPGLRWVVAFFRQFFASVTKVDYLTIRHGFINDPFLVISKIVESGIPIPICKTEVLKNDLNPTWKPVFLNVQQVGGKDSPVIIECFNFNSNGKHDLIGKVQKSLAELEKLHSVGQGECLFLPTSVGHNHDDNVITSQLETIDKLVTLESKGISYPIKVVECFEQSNGHSYVEAVIGSSSWSVEDRHGRVNQSSVSKQLDKEEDDADKDARNDDVAAHSEVAKTKWVDMEVKGLMQGGHGISPTVSYVDETATVLENQKVAEGGGASKVSMQSKVLQSQVVGNCSVVDLYGSGRSVCSQYD